MEGIELIFKEGIHINGKDGKQQEATTDSTVQEKNITYPTGNELPRKIVKKRIANAEEEGMELIPIRQKKPSSLH